MFGFVLFVYLFLLVCFCVFGFFYLFFSLLVGLGGEVFGGFLRFDHVISSAGKPVNHVKIFKARTQS